MARQVNRATPPGQANWTPRSYDVKRGLAAGAAGPAGQLAAAGWGVVEGFKSGSGWGRAKSAFRQGTGGYKGTETWTEHRWGDTSFGYQPGGRERGPAYDEPGWDSALKDVRRQHGWDEGFGAYGGSRHVGRGGDLVQVTKTTEKKHYADDEDVHYSEQHLSTARRDYVISGDINDLYETFSAREDTDLAFSTVGGALLDTHQRGGEYDTREKLIARNEENYSKLYRSELERRRLFADSFFD